MSAVSLVFKPGERPSAGDVRALASRSGQFAVSFDPLVEQGQDTGWLELLANGLTFDLTGLAPGISGHLPQRAHCFGLDAVAASGAEEAITVVPGPHLAGGGTMFPVVRGLAWLGALLAELPHVRAVAWHPARSYCAPGFFRSGVLRWIEGGVFPGFGLTALDPTADGGLQSEGLALFIGQEVQLAPELVMQRAEGAKVALRLVNWLVENGRVTEVCSITGPSGEILTLRPLQNQRIIKVNRSS